MNIEISDRLKSLPPYLFVEIDRQKKKARDEGRDIIDLGVGDPDMPTPVYIIEALNRAVSDASTHRYALDNGMPELRREIARWYKERFGVTLDPDKEVLPLIGSKEGIAHVPLAFVNSGDVVLTPDPGYPPYKSGALLAGGKLSSMPLKEENSFLPDLAAIDKAALKKARIMHINYPNNPTGAVCGRDFYKRVVDFAARNNIIVCSDAAYTELYYDGYLPPSFLEAEGAKAVGVEFHSLSKTYNMTGWRIGMACGNRDVIAGLSKVKSNIDSGVFNAIQRAAVAALRGPADSLDEMRRVYRERRDVLVDGLNSIGWSVARPKATFYTWARVLKGMDSASMCKAILSEADVVVTPGSGFGGHGEGYIRMALTVSKERLQEAVGRLKNIV